MNTDSIRTPKDFQLHLQFAVPSEHLFEALATNDGAQCWWTKFSEVSGNVGGQSSFHFPSYGFFAVMKILRRESPRLLEWECIDSKHNESTGYTDLRDWVGTRIRFEIRDFGIGKSQLNFTHFGLNQLECLTSCSSGWAFFLNESLRGYLEKGKGQPYDKERSDIRNAT